MIPYTISTNIHLDCSDLYRRGTTPVQVADTIMNLRHFDPSNADNLTVSRNPKGWTVHTDLTDPNDISNLLYRIDQALEASLKVQTEALPASRAQEDVFSKVREITVNQLGVRFEDVRPSSRFVEDLGCDSLDLVELVMHYEEEWGIDIEDEAAERIFTVDDAVRTIQERLE